jgi:hypothetical protein
MAPNESSAPISGTTVNLAKTLPQRLEQGEIVYYPASPFEALDESDRDFLIQQRVAGASGRHVEFEPGSGALHHLASSDSTTNQRLQRILGAFAVRARSWLTDQLPGYAAGWQFGPVTLRTEEEATRSLRFSQREDLLHIDPFPDGPAHGRRLLRLFVNLNPTEPRVWATSDNLARLLDRFGATGGFPSLEQSSWAWQVRQGVWQLLDARQRGRSSADDFLLRLHDYLKANDHLQERGPKRFWHFAPGSAWLVMTDGLSHAVLRGRYALEMSVFIDPATLVCPELAPARIVEHFHKPVRKSRAA